MRKFLYTLYQPYKWLFFIPFFILNTLFFSLIAILISTLISQKVGGYCGTIWARLNAFFTPMMVSVSGKENIKKNTSYIVVPNHQSNWDIFLIYGWLGIYIKWVMKMELRKVPGFGVCCEKMGHIFIDRSSTEAAVESLKAARKKLEKGASVVIFPEGTRSTTGKVAPFKRGAFRLAFDMGLNILPVTIMGTKNILPTNTLNLFPGKVQLIIHEPVDITKYSIDDIEKLMADTSSIISAPLK